ncbi:MAG: diacylglycerol kinase family lipid kinase [Eubacterium sp.]|nr:diacylglycerol kinase family lipid kinase [Eubacterium sp.]
MKKNILLIFNPCSGQKRARKTMQEVVSLLSKDGSDVTVKETAYAGHATKIAEEAGNQYDLIACCGGDGTLSEAMNGVVQLDKNIPIAYIPNGTTNDTAKTLSLPKTLSGLSELIVNEKYNKCDIGCFNGRYFFCAVSFGFGAEASFSTKQSLKNRIGHVAYILSNVKSIFDVHPVEMTVEFDNQKITGEFIFGAVINTRSVGGVFRLDKNIFRINDGKFELVLVRKLNNALEIPLTLHKLQKKVYDNREIILVQADKVKFSSPKEVSWLIDGENGGSLTEVSVENINQKIEICAPDSIIFEK